MATIAKLVVSLGADTASFQTDMQRAGRISKKELAKMESADDTDEKIAERLRGLGYIE